MKKSKDPFISKKVICPNENMPKEIEKAWFAAHKHDQELQNMSFVQYNVGEGSDYENETDEDWIQKGINLRKVDAWLFESGLVKDEKIIILYWW